MPLAAGVTDLVTSVVELPWLMTALDLVGVFFFATSGALLAARKHFDLVGSMLLSLLAGLGGGITRDILLDRGLPASLDNPVYLLPPVIMALLVYVNVIHSNRLNLTITAFDAGGLALFTVTGVLMAHEHGVNPVATVVVATIGAVGGGVLRDIVANEVPSIFDPRGVYVLPTMLGAAIATAAAMQGALNGVTGFLIALLVFSIRMLAYRYRWRLPGADISQDRDSIERLRRLATQAQASAARRVARGRSATSVQDPEPAVLGPAQEYEGQVSVQDYDPQTQAITVVDASSNQSVRFDPATGVMDVTDLRTGRTRSYDDPEHDWVAEDSPGGPQG